MSFIGLEGILEMLNWMFINFQIFLALIIDPKNKMFDLWKIFILKFHRKKLQDLISLI